jgi:hypothetical protein
MVEAGGSASFLFKAIQAVTVSSKLLGEKFQCDFAPELFILCQVDFTHSAGAQLLDDPVMGDSSRFHHFLTSDPSIQIRSQSNFVSVADLVLRKQTSRGSRHLNQSDLFVLRRLSSVGTIQKIGL